jgi:hypothetical protein
LNFPRDWIEYDIVVGGATVPQGRVLVRVSLVASLSLGWEGEC